MERVHIYIFTGVKKNTSVYKYVYHVFRPSTGIVEYYWTDVSNSDYEIELTVYYDREVRLNKVGYFAFGSNRTNTFTTNASESLWDVLQTGMRISATSNTVVQSRFYTDRHHWLCGSCGDVWYYQTSNGNRYSQGPSVPSWADWWDPPPSASNTGGVYYSECPSNCP
jgi:hypothetical protein